MSPILWSTYWLSRDMVYCFSSVTMLPVNIVVLSRVVKICFVSVIIIFFYNYGRVLLFYLLIVWMDRTKGLYLWYPIRLYLCLILGHLGPYIGTHSALNTLLKITLIESYLQIGLPKGTHKSLSRSLQVTHHEPSWIFKSTSNPGDARSIQLLL